MKSDRADRLSSNQVSIQPPLLTQRQRDQLACLQINFPSKPFSSHIQDNKVRQPVFKSTFHPAVSVHIKTMKSDRADRLSSNQLSIQPSALTQRKGDQPPCLQVNFLSSHQVSHKDKEISQPVFKSTFYQAISSHTKTKRSASLS